MNKPLNLEARGENLWDAIDSKIKFDAAGYALLEDLCRTADTIDRLQSRLNSRHCEWVKLVKDEGYTGDGDKIKVVVDNALIEIRQQRLAFMQMLKHLRLGAVTGADDKKDKKFWEEMESEFSDK